MTSGSGGSFPTAALEWLVPEPWARVLVIGSVSGAILSRLIGRGAAVMVAEADYDRAVALHRRWGDLWVVLADPSALPFNPGSFDTVLISGGFAALEPEPARSECARVLRGGGHLALIHAARDDSVPWVRRLAEVLQAYDPELMTATPRAAVAELDGCCYFPDVQARNFRTWVPITRDGMLQMVSSTPTLAGLSAQASARLLAQVGAIYDSSARHPEPLTLPYAMQCWRAAADHSEFTSQLHLPGDGISIKL
ncbi:MAG TPA: methyltransferase [Propionibacteriaceae bacterium]|nr:methyltransferase [Propionibacteriaceae bacterium]